MRNNSIFFHIKANSSGFSAISMDTSMAYYIEFLMLRLFFSFAIYRGSLPRQCYGLFCPLNF